MRRRELIAVVGGAELANLLPAHAQQSERVFRVGWVASISPLSELVGTNPINSFARAFVQRMRELGYIERKNLAIEWRSAGGKFERLPEIVRELVALNVDVIVSGVDVVIKTAQAVTSTIPVVMAGITSPVELGFVQSLARPGGNITGLSAQVSLDIVGKRVGLQSIPGLTVLYGGIVKKKWAINSAFMSMYAFASVLVVWVLFDYNMAFGPAWLSIAGQSFLGTPGLGTSAAFTLGQATVPEAASGMPALTFPMATLMYFQFVFAAITVIILAGSLLGRMNFTAWMIFCPVWMTLVYTVGAFSLWGGGWLASLGVADFSGGYVIHLAAGTSGFVAAAVIGPRLQADRDNFPPNSLLITLVGAGILWIGWNGFNGGDPYFANADAGAAVLNTNTALTLAPALSSMSIYMLMAGILVFRPEGLFPVASK